MLIAALTACHPAQPDPPRADTPEPSAQEMVGLRSAAESPARAELLPPDAALPAPAAQPAYDLAADLEGRRTIGRDALGATVRLAVVEEVFLVVGDPASSQRDFDRALWMIRRSAGAFFNHRFGKRPSRAVSIYLFFSKKAYERYCDEQYGGCGTPYGVYFRDDRRIVMNGRPGLGTLTHELVHPIVESDFPEAPDWIDEGIASLFERPSLPSEGEIHGKKNWRHPRLKRALGSARERDLASLRRLFLLSDDEFRGAGEDLHYAMARYACQWLDEKGLLWSFYRRWRDNYREDPTGETTFAQVVGETPEAANAEWTRWVRRL